MIELEFKAISMLRQFSENEIASIYGLYGKLGS